MNEKRDHAAIIAPPPLLLALCPRIPAVVAGKTTRHYNWSLASEGQACAREGETVYLSEI